MKTEIKLTLLDNEKNKIKSRYMTAFEIMLDDENNALPQSWFNFWNADAGIDIPWGTKIKLTLEVINE